MKIKMLPQEERPVVKAVFNAIIGLIIASPIAILLKTDWSAFSVVTLLIGVVTFAAGWFAASKLGGE